MRRRKKKEEVDCALLVFYLIMMTLSGITLLGLWLSPSSSSSFVKQQF